MHEQSSAGEFTFCDDRAVELAYVSRITGEIRLDDLSDGRALKFGQLIHEDIVGVYDVSKVTRIGCALPAGARVANQTRIKPDWGTRCISC